MSSTTEKETPRFTLMQTGDTSVPQTPPPVPQTPTDTGSVRVMSGVHDQTFPNLGGRSVGSVRASLREVFNISKDAQARIGGQNVTDDHNLRPEDTLEFVRPQGQKG